MQLKNTFSVSVKYLSYFVPKIIIYVISVT